MYQAAVLLYAVFHVFTMLPSCRAQIARKCTMHQLGISWQLPRTSLALSTATSRNLLRPDSGRRSLATTVTSNVQL